MNRPALLLAGFITVLNVVGLRAQSSGITEVPFKPVEDPPPIQMLVPGFTVRQLPLDLNNINCFAYAPDGRLFALGYDGNIFQLKDTNGDGLEDTADYFYKNDHREIPASIGMCWGPGGLYIASQKRVIRVKDSGNGTGVVETVTTGWVPPTGAAGSGLDAVGLTVDAKGNVYFGLGCDNWMNAYLYSKTNHTSSYNLHSERGTIIKLSSDWKHRESIATGLRFTTSLAFNANGDLFCTDQEGATWMPNGNPFDELLNIQPGRHYGFPPRHPKFLPNVVDEPSVFDYAPQHQSTCGLHFNEPVAGSAKIVGPDWWRGDAFVSGESRGKIFRTKLVKTAVGYVAQTELIACLKMLTIDSIPTPDGSLLVTCHSGDPDWGTGPQGKGKLFKISYTDPAAPQPVLAYASSPTETHIVFDRPLDPAQFKNLAAQSSIVMGRYVTAGERFESFRPRYQAVNLQQEVKRYALNVLAAGITPDNRSIVLQTPPRIMAVNYGIKLPAGAKTEQSPAFSVQASGSPPFTYQWSGLGSQQGAIDVMADLTGVEVKWHGMSGKTELAWSGWLPHLDLAVARGFTAASYEQQELFELLKEKGALTLRAQLDLDLMLHPKTQPGAALDYKYPQEIEGDEYPAEVVTVVVKSDARLDVQSTAPVKRLSNHEVSITLTPKTNQWLPLEISLPTGGRLPKLEVTWFTDEDPRPRAFPLRRIFMPFAKPETAEPPMSGPRVIPEIAGGDWERGKKVFFGEQSGCFKCHQVAGDGGHIGPDLSNLLYRDYASVYKDVTQPSAAINPDHIAYNIQLKNGETANGVIVQDTVDKVVLGQVTGQNLTIEKNQIAGMKASSLSLMPEGLLQALTPQQQKDLFTFLLTSKNADKN